MLTKENLGVPDVPGKSVMNFVIRALTRPTTHNAESFPMVWERDDDGNPKDMQEYTWTDVIDLVASKFGLVAVPIPDDGIKKHLPYVLTSMPKYSEVKDWPTTKHIDPDAPERLVPYKSEFNLVFEVDHGRKRPKLTGRWWVEGELNFGENKEE